MPRAGRLLRFALVGFLCFLLQWGVLHPLREVVNPFVADFIAFAVSAQLNFALSRLFTWRDRNVSQTLARTWLFFMATCVMTGLINALVFALANPHIGEFSAVFLAVIVSTAINFVVNDQLVFNTGTLPKLELAHADVSKAVARGVAIFMPAYNEAENLQYVVGGAVAYFKGLGAPFNVIIVDDGSSDNTQEIATGLTQLFPQVILETHVQNQGYGAALRTGFKSALTTGHEWIGFCDSDGQFKPHDFGRLIARAVDDDADICIGYRIERADGLKRKLMGRGWHLVSKLMLGYEASDVDCGFKMFRRHAVEGLSDQLIGDYATISPEMLARAQRAGHKITEIGVKHYPRDNGEQTGSNLSVVAGSFKGLYTVRRELKLIEEGN